MTSSISAEKLTELWLSQTKSWELARNNFRALSNAHRRSIDIEGVTVGVHAGI